MIKGLANDMSFEQHAQERQTLDGLEPKKEPRQLHGIRNLGGHKNAK